MSTPACRRRVVFALPPPTMTARERQARGCRPEIRKNRRDGRFGWRVRWIFGYPERTRETGSHHDPEQANQSAWLVRRRHLGGTHVFLDVLGRHRELPRGLVPPVTDRQRGHDDGAVPGCAARLPGHGARRDPMAPGRGGAPRAGRALRIVVLSRGKLAGAPALHHDSACVARRALWVRPSRTQASCLVRTHRARATDPRPLGRPACMDCGAPDRRRQPRRTRNRRRCTGVDTWLIIAGGPAGCKRL